MRPFVLSLAAGAALATFSLVASSAEQAAPAGEKSAPVAEPSAPVAAMRVYVDPETGTLVDHPVTDEQRAMAEQVRTELEQNPNPGWKVYPSGAIGADLEGRFEMSTVATVGADGKVTYHCDDEDYVGHDHAGHQLPAREEK